MRLNRLLACYQEFLLIDCELRYLMVDPKSRKVIIIESPLLPMLVKDRMARALFDNLMVETTLKADLITTHHVMQVPSISFTPGSLLALASCGRSSGLVVDCGWLETTITPVSVSFN